MAVGDGFPTWYELMTPDPAAVAPFYKAAAGWDVPTDSVIMPNGAQYGWIARSDGSHAGGVLTLSEEMVAGGASAGWMSYFYTPDVEAACSKVASLGGSVHLSPMTVPGAGKMAMLADRQGGTFYVIDPEPPADKPDMEADVFSPAKIGRARWNELGTNDAADADAFYRELFGWKTDEAMPMGKLGDYRFIDLGDVRIGAISPVLLEGALPGWLPYFAVEDITASRDGALASGGSVIMDIHQVPGGDWIFVARDPAGAFVGFVGAKKED